MKNTILTLTLSFCFCGFAQEKSTAAYKPDELNWYNADWNDNQILGASVDKAYKELLAGKTAKKTVIVAVLDSGVDIHHQDLAGKIWVNPDEIAGNNIDDDKNGYTDDVNGWNFLGNSKGENINYENYEYTRIYETGARSKDFASAKKQYEAEVAKRTKDKESFARFSETLEAAKSYIKDKTGVTVNNADDLALVNSTDEKVQAAMEWLKKKYAAGFTESQLNNLKKRNDDFLNYFLNTDFNPREISGDNPDDITDRNYGNPDVVGPRANHGTGVSGIIAGIRGNGIGIDGVANDVKIMVLRTTPNGDERDKDVALAIRYAVDNGADILNFSFGKPFSPQKQFVDDAIRYAEQHNVLIVHAAGNEGANIDKEPRFPSDIYNDRIEASNFINVGASDKKKNKVIAAEFSNYGQKHVDIFAPGVDIVSTNVGNTYDTSSGTSDAAPVVTGVAALLLSYYPELKPQQLIEILLASSLDLKKEQVSEPNLSDEKTKSVAFETLSKSGGIVNAYAALKRASETTNKAAGQR